MKLSGAAFVVLSISSGVSGLNPLRKNEEETPSLPEVGSVIEGSYIVRMDPTSTGANSQMNSLATALGANSRDVFSKTILGFAVKNIDATKAEEISKMEGVASVVPDTVVAYDMLAGSAQPVDPQLLERFTKEEKVPYGVTRVNGGRFYRGNNVAFVVDTGIFNHDDLNVDYRRGFTVDASVGMTDDNGHGTHVAGIIAAKRDRKGIRGVAAGATVIPIRVLDAQGRGSTAGVIAGLEHILSEDGGAAKAGDVINMSLGGTASQELDDAVISVANRGIIFTVAAGNEAAFAGDRSPSRTEHENVYTISAIDEIDNFADFSNYGSPPIDFSAPGVDILSTWIDNSYNLLSGTSMASPHAAGIFLLGGVTTTGEVINDVDDVPDKIISAVCSGNFC